MADIRILVLLDKRRLLHCLSFVQLVDGEAGRNVQLVHGAGAEHSVRSGVCLGLYFALSTFSYTALFP